MGEHLLKESFRNLFSIALDPSAFLVDVYDITGSIWIPRFRRNLND